jgi:toxin ParE1/3/4
VAYRIVYRREARAELDKLYNDIATEAGLAVAGNYLDGLIVFIEGLERFPKRGTERTEILPGLRIIGYKRSVSLAFSVQGNDVVILGVFHRGRDITRELLEERL